MAFFTNTEPNAQAILKNDATQLVMACKRLIDNVSGNRPNAFVHFTQSDNILTSLAYFSDANLKTQKALFMIKR